MSLEQHPDLGSMSDDDLCDEIMETIRIARAKGKGSWDRQRLRAISDESKRRGLFDGRSPLVPAEFDNDNEEH